MRCPVCGMGELQPDTRDEEYTYKGELLVIPSVLASYCSACKERITDWQETERVMQALAVFRKMVNAQEGDLVDTKNTLV